MLLEVMLNLVKMVASTALAARSGWSICPGMPGQFAPERGGQFDAESLVTFRRNQVVNISGISNETSIQIVFAIIAELANRQLTPKIFERLCYYLLMRFISGRTVFPLYSTFYRLSELYIPDSTHSWLAKHAIFKLITDHGFLSYKTIRTWGGMID